MSTPSFEWTADADASLIVRVTAGELRKSIARRLGCLPREVDRRIEHLRDLGVLPVAKREWRPAEDRALLAAVDRGERYRNLAPRFGRSRDALKMRVCALRKAPGAEERDQLSLELTG